MYGSYGLLAVGVLFGVYLAAMSITDYKPAEKIPLDVVKSYEWQWFKVERRLKVGESFSMTTFNIGYAGLDKGQDFFMDGGKMSRSRSKEQTQINMDGIQAFLKERPTDIAVFQEVDVKASRSYGLDELSQLRGSMQDYDSAFAINYNVLWVPVPITHPMGNVLGGIATFSKFGMTEAVRYQFPGGEAWPRQLAELDRCMIGSRIPVEGGKELVLVNIHLSAFDKGGQVRKLQLGYLKAFMESEFKKGNYVVVGGDWNHELPGTSAEAFARTEAYGDWCFVLPEDFTPEGFQWAVDAKVPSIRSNGKPYSEGENFRAVIDGMLVSPNVEVVSVNGVDAGFEFSDHNPVQAVFKLK